MDALTLQGLGKAYGSLVAVDAVDLAVAEGARHALIGPNGAGKTTLFDMVGGRTRPSRGRILLGDVDVTRMAEHERARRGIATTSQHANLFDGLSARDNVAIAVQREAGVARAAWRRPGAQRAVRDRAGELLDGVGLAGRAGARAGALSHGERRQLEVAVALATRPRLLLLDEPVAGMSPAESAAFVDLVRGLPPALTVLVIEHDVDVVFALATRVSVLHAGRLLAEGTPAEVRADPAVQEAYLGTADADDIFVAEGAVTAVLAVRGLHAHHGASHVLQGVDLDVGRGQVVALFGRNGVGKSTLVHTVAGLHRATSGSVRLDGEELVGRPPHAIGRRGLALVPQGRRVFAPLTVEENLRLAARGRRGAWTVDRVYDLLPRLAERRRNRGDQLSGGEQQMLAIARALLRDPRLVLLDEPSDGLAPRVVEQVAEVLGRLRDDGIPALLVEQHLRMALGLADAVVVMTKGAVAWTGTVAAFRHDPATARRHLGVG